MIMVDTLMHAWAKIAKNAEEILIQINSFLHQRMSSQRFMTLLMLRWNEQEQKMYYTGAGHEHLLIYRRKTETIETIRSGGIALRMIPDIRNIVQEKSVEMEE